MRACLLYYGKLFALPLTLAGVMATLYVFWIIAGFPTGTEFTILVKSWFQTYGLPLVFAAAFFEGLFLVGNYFPGSFVLIFSIALAGSPREAVVLLLIATVGLLIAHTVNYALGRFGWYRLFVKLGMQGSVERSRQRLLVHGGWALFASYWLPSMAAVVDSAAGILRMPFHRFLLVAIGASLFWNSIVAIVAYTLGEQVMNTMESDASNLGLLFVLIGGWMAVLWALDRRKRRRSG